MSEHFVKYINIKKYKCFDDFSAQGFKRVNLISGKNNVGKTALMEALFTNVTAGNVQGILTALFYNSLRRQSVDNSFREVDLEQLSIDTLNYFGLLQVDTNIHFTSFSIDESGIAKTYRITADDKEVMLPEKEMDLTSVVRSASASHRKVCYISSIGDSQADIIRSFTDIQKKDQEPKMNRFVHSFDSSIENIKVIGDSIQCKVIGEDDDFSYRNINEFGDGLRHYIAIIADLFAAEDEYLFIDELDNGIHYSSLDQLWEIILALSKELNVQVFATTHSRECIESYCRVAEKLKEQDISFTTLVRNKENVVKAIVRDYEVFTDSMHDNREVRGW